MFLGYNKLVRDEEIQTILDTIEKDLKNLPSAKNFATWLNNCTIDELPLILETTEIQCISFMYKNCM